MIPAWRIAHWLGTGAFIVLAACLGYLLKPAPAVPPLVPSYEQLTIAAGTLVHGLEVQNDYSLSAAPDFVGCHQVKAGLACDFGVSYIDETTAVWELVLNRHNTPTVIRRVKQAKAPAA